MHQLGIGLHEAGRHEDELSVREAELAMLRQLGAPEGNLLVVQGNLANTYDKLGRVEEALNLYRDVYSGELILYGTAHEQTIISASNYAWTLKALHRYDEVKTLMHKTLPVARRVLGESDITTLRLRWNYASSLYLDSGATLDDVREAVATLEDTERTARQVLGGTHPTAMAIADSLRRARAALAARGDDVSSVCEALRKAKM